jgi:methylase of polypeptide subunit release factors
MPTVLEIETRRQQHQETLDAARDQADRNRWGQFATPMSLGLQIAEYAAALWRKRTERVRFLDPALGTGSFYSALRQAFSAKQIARAAGVELDPRIVATASDLWLSTGLEVLAADFTELSPPTAVNLFNLILTNPPYVRHHHLERSAKERLQADVARNLGIDISGLAGLYCYFLLLADAWLAPRGLAIWLIPSEFMDVNYGEAVKRYLTEHVKLLHIHRFCPMDVQFSDALVSSAVVVFEKTAPPKRHSVTFTHGGSLLKPSRKQRVPLATLCHAHKWSVLPIENAASIKANVDEATFADLFDIRRGLATGANDFFILARSDAIKLGVPKDAVKPVLPSPRHLRAEIIDGDHDGYPLEIPALCLIDCRLPEKTLRDKHPAFWKYLESGKRRGIDKGYLTSRRNPWYSQEARTPAPFLCTYMGRPRNGRKPFRFIWNRSEATATNLYLMLYPKAVLAQALAQKPALHETVFSELQAIDTETFLRAGRVYGGGLYKMEPTELSRLPGTQILRAIGLPLSRQQTLF